MDATRHEVTRMPTDQLNFDDETLRAALKRDVAPPGASPMLKAKVEALVKGGAAIAEATDPLDFRSSSVRGSSTGSAGSGGRVFGLPRAWGVAAAVVMLIVGGSLITYQLYEPGRPRLPTQAQILEKRLEALVGVHHRVQAGQDLQSDSTRFTQSLPSVMPLGSLSAPARFVGARVDRVDGALCYAVSYLIDGKPFTLVTAAVDVSYQVAEYDEMVGGTRLVGGGKEGYLVCLMGDPSTPATTYKAMLDQVEMHPSPSTQPLSHAAASGEMCQK